MKKSISFMRKIILTPIFGLLFLGLFNLLTLAAPVSATPTEQSTSPQPTEQSTSPNTNTLNTPPTQSPEPPQSPENAPQTETAPSSSSSQTSTDSTDPEKDTTCLDQVGAIGWLICPTTGFIAKSIDSIYGIIEKLLVVNPMTTDQQSPIYLVWEYARNITNIIFIIFLLVVIYSQLTGLGLSNYDIKRTLPRLIIVAILINLSYLICSAAVDISNIIGSSLRDFLTAVGESVTKNGANFPGLHVSMADVFTAVTTGGLITGLAIGFSGGGTAFLLLLLPIILGGIISVIIGFLTIALRQSVIALLVMLSPLAFVTFLLPNTEDWYKKWRTIFTQMLFFYPMFSFLFGASRLVGWVLISSAESGLGALGVILGIAVQILPLFLAVPLMKMSGTILGSISSKLDNLNSKINSGAKNYLSTPREIARQKYINKHIGRHNPLSGGYWLAKRQYKEADYKDQLSKLEDSNARLFGEQLNALKRGQRIIGYDRTGKPIYTKRPISSNSYMRREFANREIKLRTDAAEIETENAVSGLGQYARQHNIKDAKIKVLTERQGENYLEYMTQLSAKTRNDRSDKRYYFEKVKEASLLGEGDEKYERLVVRAAGLNGHHNEDPNVRHAAITAAISDAYILEEKERLADVSRYTNYYSKLVTKDVLSEFSKMREHKNMDGIIAATSVLATRGDYDQIGKGLREYMDAGNVHLATEDANNLALHLLSMKNADPTLGRLGKFINMETWRYTDPENTDRTESTVTMEQYITGKIHNADGRVTNTKINVISGLRGTSIKNMDRTAINNLKQLTAILPEDKLIELDQALMPQIVSALPTFDSGSEQILNTLSYLTGMSMDVNTGKWSSDSRTKEGSSDPYHDLPSEFFVKRTITYLKGLPPNELIRLKSDTFSAIKALFIDYFGDEKTAKQEFLRIQEENGNIARIMAGDKSALNAAKSSVFKWLDLDKKI